MKKFLIARALLVAVVLSAPALSITSRADDGGDGGDHGDKGKGDGSGSGSGASCPTAPLDGGLSMLAIAGIGYGVKKMKAKRNTGKLIAK